jgi:hypothetical protein
VRHRQTKWLFAPLDHWPLPLCSASRLAVFYFPISDGNPAPGASSTQELKPTALAFPYTSLRTRGSRRCQTELQVHFETFDISYQYYDRFNALEVHANTADPQYAQFFGNYDRLMRFDLELIF